MPPPPRERGATSVVLLVAVIPVIIVVFTLCIQAGAITYAWIRADQAAQAGARAAASGRDPARSARATLSRPLSRSALVRTTRTDITVSIDPPLLFGLARQAAPRVSARASIVTEGTP